MSIKKSKYLIALCAGTALAGVIPSTLVSCSSASPFKIGIDGSNTVDLTYQTSAAFNFIYKHNDSKYSKATGFSSVEIVNVSSAISHNFKVVSWSSDLSKNNNIKVNFSMDIIGEWSLTFGLKFSYVATYRESDKSIEKTIDYTVNGLTINHHNVKTDGSVKLLPNYSTTQNISLGAKPGLQFATFKFILDGASIPQTNIVNVKIKQYGNPGNNIALLTGVPIPEKQDEPIDKDCKKDNVQIPWEQEGDYKVFNLHVLFIDAPAKGDTQTIASLTFEMLDARLYEFNTPISIVAAE